MIIDSCLFNNNGQILSNSLFFEVSGFLILIKMQKLHFYQNYAKDHLVSFKNLFSLIVFQNVTFENNRASSILYLFHVGIINVFDLKCHQNNILTISNEIFLQSIKPGPCFIFEEFVKLQIEKIEILEGIAESSITGIVIIQSSLIPEQLYIDSGKFLNFFFIYYNYISL